MADETASARREIATGETGLNRAPRLITKAQRIAAAEALGLDPRLVQSIVIDGKRREVVVTQFVAITPATSEAVNAPAHGTIHVVRSYPFEAEQREAERLAGPDHFDDEMAR